MLVEEQKKNSKEVEMWKNKHDDLKNKYESYNKEAARREKEIEDAKQKLLDAQNKHENEAENLKV